MSTKAAKEKRPTPDKEVEFKPTIGRVIHFVEPDGTTQGIHRPALVSLDYNGKEMGFTVVHPQRIYFRPFKDTHRDEQDKAPLTWHVPERG